jgi:hypothetical protein
LVCASTNHVGWLATAAISFIKGIAMATKCLIPQNTNSFDQDNHSSLFAAAGGNVCYDI